MAPEQRRHFAETARTRGILGAEKRNAVWHSSAFMQLLEQMSSSVQTSIHYGYVGLNYLNVDEVPMEMYRMGVLNPANRRPINVVFGNIHATVQVRRVCHYLKHSPEYNHVYVRHSYTRALRELSALKKAAELNVSYVIHNDKVVARSSLPPRWSPQRDLNVAEGGDLEKMSKNNLLDRSLRHFRSHMGIFCARSREKYMP
uniref:Nucleotid_trans domain-containing protein n=1 Tax=Ascaris lumbricoides TaxID=6252 RepID=A0A0M3IAA0_ASCLU